MKLYTEEQVTELLKEILKNDFLKGEDIIPIILGIAVTPIELPSDEEIEKAVKCSNLGLGYDFSMNVGFKKGAKWMREKIQAGKNEQQ